MFLEFQKFYNTEEGAGQGSTEETVSKETTKQETQEPYKAFATEEDYQKELKSAQSKAKNEILQKLGVKSVDEGTQNLTKADQLEQDLKATVSRLQQLEEENVLVRAEISDDYKKEALTLARASVDENTSLEVALKQVVEKFPNLLKAPKKGVERVGLDGANTDPKTVSEQLTQQLSKKYPWLNK